jgi:hypothetical protein
MRAVFLRLENNDFTHFCLPNTIIDLLAARALCASDPGRRSNFKKNQSVTTNDMGQLNAHPSNEPATVCPAVSVGRENLQPFPCSRSAGEAQSFQVLDHKSWRQPRGLCIHHPSACAVLATPAGLLCPIASFGLAGKVRNRASRRRGFSRYRECFLDGQRADVAQWAQDRRGDGQDNFLPRSVTSSVSDPFARVVPDVVPPDAGDVLAAIVKAFPAAPPASAST